MLTRRTFLGWVGGGLAAARATTARATGAAQPESRRYRIGIMEARAASANAAQLAAFRRGLEELGYVEQWVCYGTRWYSAKEFTVLPKRTVTVKDAAAYGLILTQGHGTIGIHTVSTPSMIRFGEMTEDELFVTADVASAGVKIQNLSDTDPLVLLKHFGPGNPDMVIK